MTRLLHDNITEGTGTAAYTGCAGQAGKTGTTDDYTDAWFAGYQPNLATVVWVGYPRVERRIEMSSVHGITVFGGTFPAEIWHSLYSGGGVPCEEFSEPEDSRSAGRRYYGRFTAAPSPSRRAAAPAAAAAARKPPPTGSAAVGGYDRRLQPRRLRARAPARNRRRLPPPPPIGSASAAAALPSEPGASS